MTSISWTGQTWNPVVGCSIVSKGCTHCYAMGMAHRLGSMAKTPHYRGLTQKVNGHPVWTGRIAAAPDHIWQEPLRRRKPTTWFVNSMGDLFHDDVPTELIDRVFAIMALCPRHTFQILTKRPDRMRRYLSDDHEDTDLFERIADLGAPMVEDGDSAHDMLLGIDWPLPNVWLGTSVEDQTAADSRIPPLLATPAALRFISAEPLLGPVDLEPYLSRCHAARDGDCNWPHCPQERDYQSWCRLAWDDDREMHTAATARLDWVICGGESGPGARPMHPDWARTLRDQCAAAGVPFHFKQWGEWAPAPEGATHPLHCRPVAGSRSKIVTITDKATGKPILNRVGRKAAGNLLDGVAHDAIPPHAGGA